MSLDFYKSTGFRIRQLDLIDKQGNSTTLTGFYQELNIFDSIFQPCLNGNILINDSVGLSDRFLFDGNEFLKVHIGKVDDEKIEIEKIFRIYKQSDRISVNGNTERYILHFVSEEYITSLTETVGQTYIALTYTDMVLNILSVYLKADIYKIINGQFDETLGVKDRIIGDDKSPLQAINELTKISLDTENRPCFLFYENIFGYNFVSLTNLLKNKSMCTLTFNPKNLNSKLVNDIDDLTSIRYFKVMQQYDALNNIKNGVYSGVGILYDKISGTTSRIHHTFDSKDHPKNPNNKGFAVSNIMTANGPLLNNYSKSNREFNYTNIHAKEILKKQDEMGEFDKMPNFEYIIGRRKGIFSNLFSQRVKVVIPGNFAITTGVNVELNVPKFSEKTSNEDNLDRTLNAHYLVIACRHKLTPDNKHETIFEACTNSSNKSDSLNTLMSSTFHPSQSRV